MNQNELVNQAIINCPYLLRIQIERDKRLKEDAKKWLKQIIETAKIDAA